MGFLPDSSVALARELIFRVATAADAAQIAAWNRQLITDEGHNNTMGVDQLEARMRNWLATEYRAIIFDARATPASTPEPVAYAVFRDTPDWIHLRQFFVMRDCRRRGIGTRAVALLRDSVFAPDKAIIVEAMTWNRAALSFWRAMGFADRYVGLESRPAASAPHSSSAGSP
ncbi:MAG: GNAT family N-acetyltransferase [Pseudomonadota bacterium]|nr:GNAT family N-acetyltransferase [Pseudomonadota bacterium]